MDSLFRPGAASGVWCCFLPTLALFSALFNHSSDLESEVKGVKVLSLVLSVFLAAMSVIAAYDLLNSAYKTSKGSGGIVNRIVDCVVKDIFERASSRDARLRRHLDTNRPPQPPQQRSKKKKTDNLTAKSGVVLSVFLFVGLWFFGPRLTSTLPVILLASICLAFYSLNLRRAFETFPKSFTFGEGCLAMQGIILFSFEAIVTLFLDPTSDDVTTVSGSFARIGKAGLLSCLVFCALPLVPGLSRFRSPSWYLCSGIVVLFGVTLPYLMFTMKREPITWVLGLIWTSWGRLGFMALSLSFVAVSLVIVGRQTVKATTSVRKYFHLFTVVVYTFGVFVDPDFLFLSSIVAVCTLTLIESFRFHGIEPFSSFLDSVLFTFLDEKDSGALILTHIYLQTGCSLPLWLSHDLAKTNAVCLLSGVLAIGVGDAAASVVGSRFGRVKLPDSNKSVEGTLASVAAQLFYLWALEALGVMGKATLEWNVTLFLPIMICAVVEAIVTQVDNIVLPLVLYTLL
jgi:dolichol kinase